MPCRIEKGSGRNGFADQQRHEPPQICGTIFETTTILYHEFETRSKIVAFMVLQGTILIPSVKKGDAMNNKKVYLKMAGMKHLVPNDNSEKGYFDILKSIAENNKVEGFVPGDLINGNLALEHLRSKNAITLHSATMSEDQAKNIIATFGFNGIVFRGKGSLLNEENGIWVLIPMKSCVSSDVYEAVSRMVAHRAGLMEGLTRDTFDPVLIASIPELKKDGTIDATNVQGKLLDPAEILSDYSNWRDKSEWPRADGEFFDDGNPISDEFDVFDEIQKRDELNLDCEDSMQEELESRLEYVTDEEGNKTKSIVKSLLNVVKILKFDPKLSGIAHNVFADRIDLMRELPWRNLEVHREPFWRSDDDSQLIVYLAENYREFNRQDISDAFRKAADDRSFHPVRDMLDNLPEWDGVMRIDRIFCHYLGAEESEYVYAVSHITFVAAVARIMEPGCKFDNMLVLVGNQGAGKSTLVNKIAYDDSWYSDSLHLTEISKKDAAEKLQGVWILEIGELAGIKKIDVESLKAFVSRECDRYREPYARIAVDHLRQCIIIGTSNHPQFLRDITGNRRFWPVKSNPDNALEKPWDMPKEDVLQIWAEAKYYYDHGEGEKLCLPPEIEEEAFAAQEEALETDDRQGLLENFLDTPIPANWYTLPIQTRKMEMELILSGMREVLVENAQLRKRVCAAEVWIELFGKDKADLDRKNSNEIIGMLSIAKGWKRVGKQRCNSYGTVICFERINNDVEFDPLSNDLNLKISVNSLINLCGSKTKEDKLEIKKRQACGPVFFDETAAIEGQKKFCEDKGLPYFAPDDGVCYSCKAHIYEGPNGITLSRALREHVTGCPICKTSYC